MLLPNFIAGTRVCIFYILRYFSFLDDSFRDDPGHNNNYVSLTMSFS